MYTSTGCVVGGALRRRGRRQPFEIAAEQAPHSLLAQFLAGPGADGERDVHSTCTRRLVLAQGLAEEEVLPAGDEPHRDVPRDKATALRRELTGACSEVSGSLAQRRVRSATSHRLRTGTDLLGELEQFFDV